MDLEPGLPNGAVWIASDPQMGKLDLRFQPVRYMIFFSKEKIFFKNIIFYLNPGLQCVHVRGRCGLAELVETFAFSDSLPHLNIYIVIGGGPPHMRKV